MLWIIVILFHIFIHLLRTPLINFILGFVSKTSKDYISKKNEICKINTVLKSISMIDNFPDYARNQRRLNKIQEELKEEDNSRLSKNIKLKLVLTYGIDLIAIIFMIILLWKERFTPAFLLPVSWLAPCAQILSWPTGVEGAISLHSWLLINKVVFGYMKA